MLLLMLLSPARFHLVQLLANGLVFLILCPHFQPFIQDGKAVLLAHDFAAQIVIIFVHGGNFFIKLFQENICQGGFHHKDEIPPINWKLSYTSVRVTAAF